MVHQIEYKIFGDDMQAVIIELDPREKVQAEAGAMMFMEEGIEMSTELKGGTLGGLKRLVGGESLFIVSYINKVKKKRHIAFAAPYPGKIIPLNLGESGPIVCQRTAFLACAFGIQMEIVFTKKISAGFFGGEGFFLQELLGDGYAFIHACGAVLTHVLDEGETLLVDTGCLVAMQNSVKYEIKMTGGVKSALFSGEGLFHTKLRGPGKVYLQTLPYWRMTTGTA